MNLYITRIITSVSQHQIITWRCKTAVIRKLHYLAPLYSSHKLHLPANCVNGNTTRNSAKQMICRLLWPMTAVLVATYRTVLCWESTVDSITKCYVHECVASCPSAVRQSQLHLATPQCKSFNLQQYNEKCTVDEQGEQKNV